MGVDNMVMMVKITATPSVLEEMSISFVMEMLSEKNDDDKEQTHDMANRFRNRASLFVLATWTLGNHVAPEQEVLKMMLMVMMIMMRTETHLIALIG